jgi:hypothetical protein
LDYGVWPVTQVGLSVVLDFLEYPDGSVQCYVYFEPPDLIAMTPPTFGETRQIAIENSKTIAKRMIHQNDLILSYSLVDGPWGHA